MERKPWSTEKKNRARDRAERIGQLQTFVTESPILPTVAVVGFFGFIGGAVQLIESINL
jgi:nitrate reductase NapE component